MKSVLSILVAFVFLLQNFVTVQAMPIQEGKAEMPCMIKKEVSKKHTCCAVLSGQQENSKKKKCCSKTSKMSCCISVIALVPSQYKINFIAPIHQKKLFEYLDSYSTFEFDIFHPPILV